MKQKIFFKAISIFAFVVSLSINSYAQGLTEGVSLINKEKYKAATEFFNSKLSSDAKNPEIYYNLGEISFLQGKYDDAKAFYEKGTAADPNFALNYIGIAKTFLAKKDTSSARGFIDKAIELPNVKRNVINFDIAEAYSATGQNLTEAITLVNDAMKPDKKNPNARKNPRGFYILGTIYLQLNNGSEAIKNFEFAIDLDPKNIKAKLGAASVYNTIKNYDEAKGYYLRALVGADATNPIANKEFAEHYYVQNKYAEALHYQEIYINNSEKTTSNLYRYATLAYLLRDYKKTVEIINDYMTLDDKNYGMLRLLAYSNLEIQDFAASSDAFKKYFTVTDSSKVISSDFEKYGKVLSKLGQDSLANINYIKCAEMDSTKADLYSLVAEDYFKAKKYAEAIKYYNLKSEKSQKNSVKDLINLGLCHFQLNEYHQVDSVFGKISQMLPNEPIGYFWQARANSHIDTTSQLGLAKPFYEKVIAICAADTKKYKNMLIESYDYLGYYYILKDDYAASKPMWQKIVEIDPENEKALGLLNRAEFKKIK